MTGLKDHPSVYNCDESEAEYREETQVGIPNNFETSSRHHLFIKSSFLTSHQMHSETEIADGATLASNQKRKAASNQTVAVASSGAGALSQSIDSSLSKASGNPLSKSQRTAQSQSTTQGAAEKHSHANVYSPQQIRDFIAESIKEFISIFKTALFKFYQIRSYMRS